MFQPVKYKLQSTEVTNELTETKCHMVSLLADFRIWHNSKQTPNDWWDKFSAFANKSVFAFRFDSRHIPCNLYATNVVSRLHRYRVSLSTIQPNYMFRYRSIERNVYAIDRSIYLLIFTTTFNLCEWMLNKFAQLNVNRLIMKFWTNSPHKASITVNNDAAGNRTDTLNSNICSKSTGKRENKIHNYLVSWSHRKLAN